MSNKLTDDKLKELILEVLQEKVSIDLKDDLDDIDKLRSKLGFSGSPSSLGADDDQIAKSLKSLVDLDKDPVDTLDDDDFKAAFAKDPKNKEFKAANF